MNNQEKILKTLKDFKRLPTSRIAAICGMDYTTCSELLTQMEKAKVVKAETETLARYWRLYNAN